MKSISQLYFDSYANIAEKQRIKYGNPIGEAPLHVPNVLENAVDAKELAPAQARKLAILLGRRAYGEIGLTNGIVSATLNRVLTPNGRPSGHVRNGIASAISKR